MTGASDRLADGFPHGTRAGYQAGCKGGGACPAGAEHGLSCRRANSLAAGDYQYQKLARTGAAPAEIAHALGLIPDTTGAAARLRGTTAEALPSEPVPAVVEAKPAKWAVRHAWVAFDPSGKMHGPFDGQRSAMDLVGEQLRKAAPPAAAEQKSAKRRAWTQEDAEQLRRLHAEGLSDGEIARRIGRSQPVVSSKRRDAGLSANGTQSGKKAAS